MARILVAEDDATVRELVVRSLTEDGHTLTVAADGVAALDALNRHHGEFDLLLTDVKMPVMDGIALAGDRTRPSGNPHHADDRICRTGSMPWCMR
jgi:two-component system, cell cycle response regulator CpdR